MSLSLFLWSAVLLSLERLCYVWIWRTPERFRAVCDDLARAGTTPVTVLRFLFYGFKALQLAVFAGWCLAYGGGSLWPPDGDAWSFGVGAALIAAGQLLNASVFYRLGRVGVFYGNRFGYEIPWCRAFPFSIVNHPQYVGTVCSIWGFFVVMRFPNDDWFVLPVLETLYYVLGARFEQ